MPNKISPCIWYDLGQAKAARDAGWEALMQDPRMADMQPVFDTQRIIYASFDLLAES